VADLIVVAYLLGWALTSAGLVISSRRLRSRRRPALIRWRQLPGRRTLAVPAFGCCGVRRCGLRFESRP